MQRIILDRLFQGHTLTQPESEQLFHTIMSGELDPVQLAAVMMALKFRGETPEELAGAASASLKHAVLFPRPDYDFADIVGTGGDGTNSINISTASAFVAAAMGFPIAKHGGRAASSQAGSSDVLSVLGIDLSVSPEVARQSLDSRNLCFLFAPHYHAGFRHAAPVRQKIKARTIFNLLGPLINPARPSRILLGVYHPDLLQPMVNALQQLNYQHAIVVHGTGLDEVAIHDRTRVAELKDGEIRYYDVTPEDFDLPRYVLADLIGGTPEENGQHLRVLLQGTGKTAHEVAVAANVAMAMRLFGHQDLAENSAQALAMIRSGQAYQLVTAMTNGGQHD